MAKQSLYAVYARIFFVELAYWIVSIGMVFVNEFVLNDNILTDDLTVFITTFQILFSLSILVTLNHITKKYLNPAFDDELIYYDSRLKCDSEFESLDNITANTKLIEQDVLEASHNVAKSQLQSTDKSSGSNSHQPEHVTLTPYPTCVKPAESKLQPPSSSSSISSSSDSDGLMQLLIVDLPPRVKLETCKIVFPLSVLYIGMLLLNNFCLKNVGVAFYFVSRSLTTVFNVTFTYFLINEPVSRGALLCCAFIVLGFILGIDQESVIGSLSLAGVVFGVASSLFTSLFSIYTKKTLAKLDRNIWVLVLYNNINAILLCSPLLVIHGDIRALISEKTISLTFWSLLSISGVMAFFISIVTNASIKYTSPLTHNISGTAKACLQTVIAVIYYQEHKSILWWLSNIVILVASAAYSRIKQKEMERRSLAVASATQAA